MLRVGLISDTHGLLRPEAVEFLRGSNFIVHAGDICEPKILSGLNALAPVTAVRGNNDQGPWAKDLRTGEFLRIGAVTIYVIHDIADLNIDLTSAGIRVVVSGHSHKPHIEERNGVLFVNPGSAGQRRFRLPIAAAELLVEGESVTARITELVNQNAPMAEKD